MRTFALVAALMYMWPASALAGGICDAVNRAERLEARIVTLQADPNNTQRLGLTLQAQILTEYDLSDPRLAEAVAAYAASVARIDELSRAAPIDLYVEAHKSAAHRSLLRFMVNTAYAPCSRLVAAQNNQTEGALQSSAKGAQSAGKAFNWLVMGTAAVIMIGALVAGLMSLMKFKQRRDSLRERHYCNVAVMVRSKQVDIRTKMIDISAVGAKIRLPEGQDLAPVIKIEIERELLVAKVVWQNAHYAGLVFHRPIRLRKVRRLSEGKQDRFKPEPAKPQAAERDQPLAPRARKAAGVTP